MNTAETQLNTTASHIANLPSAASPQDTVDLSTNMVNLLESSINFAASAKVVHVADEMQQSTLSMLG
jgi:flagellar hook protein FlgE